MESQLYAYLKYKKSVKFTSDLTRYINACKILITLLNCQLLNPKLVLDYFITNLLDLQLNKNKDNKKDISLRILNNNKEKIRLLVDIDNKEEDIKPVNIDKQKLATPN